MSSPKVVGSLRRNGGVVALRQITDGVFTHERPQRFFGMQVGARMTALQLADGLLLHSPTDASVEEVAAVGEARWVLAPNLLHHLYVGPWVERGLEGFCAPGLQAKRPDVAFTAEVTEQSSPCGSDALFLPLSCFSITNEVVVLHRPSRTLVVTDLVFNLPPSTPWPTKAAMCCAGGYPGCKTTVLERIGMNRPQARTDLRALLDLDWDRLIPSHGTIIETGGKDALRQAFHWLGPL